MKKLILSLSLLLNLGYAVAQTPDGPPPPPPPPNIEKTDDITEAGHNDKNPVYTVAEQMPEFPGGEDALLKYLAKNITYPPVAKDAGTQGTIYISFVVTKKGKIEDVKVMRNITGPGAKDCANESVRVIKAMPKWKPGIQKKKKVNVRYNLPIKFILR